MYKYVHKLIDAFTKNIGLATRKSEPEMKEDAREISKLMIKVQITKLCSN